jgi:hypothetical protein
VTSAGAAWWSAAVVGVQVRLTQFVELLAQFISSMPIGNSNRVVDLILASLDQDVGQGSYTADEVVSQDHGGKGQSTM